MSEITTLPQPGDALESRSDEELGTMIAKARAVLAQREEERRKQAMEQIANIARAAGLAVNVTKKPRRGRPPKKPQSGT